MASKEDIGSDSVDVAVTELPGELTEYVKTMVCEYITQAKDVMAEIHRVKGQQSKLVLTLGRKTDDKERASLTRTNDEVEKTNTILVTNLPATIDEDVLEIFFESTKKQGGGPVKNVKIISNKSAAIIEFYDESSVKNVLKKIPITFGEKILGIAQISPVLGGDETIRCVALKDFIVANEFSETLFKEQLKYVQPSGPQLAALLREGTRVVRGMNWESEYGNQDDGGEGTVTIVPEHLDTNWLCVKWDNGNEFTYRMGVKNCYDLKLAL